MQWLSFWNFCASCLILRRNSNQPRSRPIPAAQMVELQEDVCFSLGWWRSNTLTLSCASLFLSVIAELQTICKQYWNRIYNLEGDKWELERLSKLKEFEVIKKSVCFVPWPLSHLLSSSSCFRCAEENRAGVFRSRLSVWGSEMGFGIWSEKEGLGGMTSQRGGPICKAPPPSCFPETSNDVLFTGGRKIAIRLAPFLSTQILCRSV